MFDVESNAAYLPPFPDQDRRSFLPSRLHRAPRNASASPSQLLPLAPSPGLPLPPLSLLLIATSGQAKKKGVCLCLASSPTHLTFTRDQGYPPYSSPPSSRRRLHMLHGSPIPLSFYARSMRTLVETRLSRRLTPGQTQHTSLPSTPYSSLPVPRRALPYRAPQWLYL